MADSKLADVWGRTMAQGGTISNHKDVLARSPIGNPDLAITQTFQGINHRGNPSSIPINKDYYGLTLFTKPDIRMTTDNISRVRIFTPMLTERALSIPRALRASLDWRHNNQGQNSYPSPLVDPKQIFIPFLTNLCISNSGWQDTELPTHTTEPGLYGEMFSYADGIASIYRTYDITVNFRNIPGDPITPMFYYWVHYCASVFEGVINPYSNNISEYAIDYQTSIWRIVLDPTKRWVVKIGRSGPAFPVGVPIGSQFNYDTDTPINRNDQISVTFRAIGAEYLDPILVLDFNRVVVQGNGDMADNGRREAGLVKVDYNMITLFNYKGYPRIDPATYELEWYVYSDEMALMLGDTQGADEAEFDLNNVDTDGMTAVMTSWTNPGEYVDPETITS